MRQEIEYVEKEQYLNPVAKLFLQMPVLKKVLVAGRGFGKSFVNGNTIARMVEVFPKSRGLFVGPTYTQIFTNSLLPVKSAWEFNNYYEKIHYVVGKTPPNAFERPYAKPDKFENVITFWNGTTINLGSFDRPQLIRGASYDWVIVDEALLINYQKYTEVITPTLRGSHILLKDHPLQRSEQFTSSMPYGASGQWLLDFKSKMQQYPKDYFYIEGTSWDNIHVLGIDTLKSWRRDMPQTQYDVEVMNRRNVRHGELFYPSLKDTHFYIESYNYDHIDSINILGTAKDCRWDSDCKLDSPLNLSFDFGAFNTLLVDQERKHPYTIHYLNHLYVSHPDTLNDLVDNFHNYYLHMHNRILYIWGDKSGNKRMENSKLTMFEQVMDRLRSKGWRPIKRKTADVEHLERHRFIDVLLREEHSHLPAIRINYNNCKDLRISLEDAKMRNEKKDKRSEGNPAIAQQHATHATDAFDYRLYHAYKHLERHRTTPINEARVGAPLCK